MIDVVLTGVTLALSFTRKMTNKTTGATSLYEMSRDRIAWLIEDSQKQYNWTGSIKRRRLTATDSSKRTLCGLAHAATAYHKNLKTTASYARL